MALKNWSTTAGSNATVDSINWAENQAPSTVNDSSRALMADVRTWYNDYEWRDWGHTVTYASATTFTVATDVTAIYVVDQPIRCTDATTLYGKVASRSYSAPNTTVTVTLDSGSLSASLTAVSLGQKPTGKPIDVSGVRGAVANSGNETIAGNKTFSGQTTFSATATFTGVQYFDNTLGPGYVQNYSLSGAVASNALTMTLSGYDGTALSSTNKAQFTFRNATAATGTSSTVDATSDLTLTISSGSTLGTTSAVPARFWIVLFNDAGTLRLGAINCSTSTAIYPLSDDTLASSTAEGGAGAADSAGVIYTGSAVTAKAMRVLGYVEHTQATAGTYATTPSKVQLWQPGMKLPGDIVQSTRNTISTLVSGNTIFPADNTIPQNTEGMSILDATPITPTSTANFLRTRANTFGADTAIGQIGLGLFRDSVAGALAAVSMGHSASANYVSAGSIEFMEKAPSTSAITYKLRGGPEAANTTYFNSGSGTVLYGGVAMTSIVVEELMG